MLSGTSVTEVAQRYGITTDAGLYWLEQVVMRGATEAVRSGGALASVAAAFGISSSTGMASLTDAVFDFAAEAMRGGATLRDTAARFGIVSAPDVERLERLASAAAPALLAADRHAQRVAQQLGIQSERGIHVIESMLIQGVAGQAIAQALARGATPGPTATGQAGLTSAPPDASMLGQAGQPAAHEPELDDRVATSIHERPPEPRRPPDPDSHDAEPPPVHDQGMHADATSHPVPTISDGLRSRLEAYRDARAVTSPASYLPARRNRATDSASQENLPRAHPAGFFGGAMLREAASREVLSHPGRAAAIAADTYLLARRERAAGVRRTLASTLAGPLAAMPAEGAVHANHAESAMSQLLAEQGIDARQLRQIRLSRMDLDTQAERTPLRSDPAIRSSVLPRHTQRTGAHLNAVLPPRVDTAARDPGRPAATSLKAPSQR